MSSTPETNIDDDDPSQGLAIAFRNDKVVARAIVKSDYLKDAVNELIDMKQAGATCCTVGMYNYKNIILYREHGCNKFLF